MVRDDVDRVIAGVEVGAAMFFSLNPLLVMVVTPLLLAQWKRQAEQGRELSVMHKMAMGALLVAASYLVVAAAEAISGEAPAHWLWLLSFFVVFTLGELYILPTGLGLFARLAPPKLGATTVAAWFLVIFTGSLAAGLIGRLWSRHRPHVPSSSCSRESRPSQRRCCSCSIDRPSASSPGLRSAMSQRRKNFDISPIRTIVS